MNACWSSHYSSPPPERELCVDGEHRSRRDMSPQGRKRAALMISRDQPASIGSSYQTYRKVNVRKCLILILSTEKMLKIEYLKFTGEKGSMFKA